MYLVISLPIQPTNIVSGNTVIGSACFYYQPYIPLDNQSELEIQHINFNASVFFLFQVFFHVYFFLSSHFF